MLQGVVEADETYFLRSSKGQHVQTRKARRRGGSGAKRGPSDEQEPVLVARDRSGVTADFILQRAGKAPTIAALAPVLASDAVLCTDCSGSLGAAARHLSVEHHALNLSRGERVQGAWHIQNANAYHARLKNWIPLQWGGQFVFGQLPGLVPCLGPVRTISSTTAPFLALAIGA